MYAVIEAAGMHGQTETVHPVYTSKNLGRALAVAQHRTDRYRASMRRYGGSSGYYVVVEGTRASEWLGMDADKLPRAGDTS